MQYRKFGKENWKVSEVGYGMWGLAGWMQSDDKETAMALDKSVEMGCNFFDTAWDYGAGKSERILSDLLKRYAAKKLYVSTKIPPMNKKWPPIKGSSIDDVFPVKHLLEYTDKSLKNLQLETIDLMHFHVWEDEWAGRDEWKMTVEKLKKEGKVQAFGVSVNRWEPANCLSTLDTGLIDAVQVIYNIFDQSPEDVLFPYCLKNNIAVIARVPFDEGSLTGALTKNSTWEEGDWRNIYFCTENLNPTVDRVEELKKIVPLGMTLTEMALQFIKMNEVVSTMIPGMRKVKNVESNMRISDGEKLNAELYDVLRKYRWDRKPCAWSC